MWEILQFFPKINDIKKKGESTLLSIKTDLKKIDQVQLVVLINCKKTAFETVGES